MYITEIEINNILSIEKATISVKQCGLTLFDGWNYDDDRANGAGKTAICNAIAFALYDKLPRKITKSEILRWGAKSGFSRVTLTRGNVEYSVKRTRPNGVEYFIDGQKKTMTQEEFESHIGLSYEQFMIAMYDAQDERQNFLFRNDTDKKDFFLNLMNLSVFNSCYSLAKNKIKHEDAIINHEKIQLQGFLSKMQAYSESLVNEEIVRPQVEALEAEIAQLNQQLATHRAVQQPDMTQFYALEAKINEKRREFTTIRQNIAVLRSEHRGILSRVVPEEDNGGRHVGCADQECPSCKTPLTITGNRLSLASDRDAVNAQRRLLNDQHREEASRIASRINDLERDLLRENELNRVEMDIKAKAANINREYEVAQRAISEVQRVIYQKEASLSQLSASIQGNESLREKIGALKVKASASKKVIDEANERIELLQQAAQIFSPTGAPAYIMDSAIDSFNLTVTDYVRLIWPSASYELQTYKENKDGTKSAKFSEVLTINGNKCSIGALSGGQQKALSLAVDFAIRDVIDSHFGVSMNPIILDEPFNGLDTAGREVVIELLENLAVKRNIWVIDHMSESKALFNDIVRVEKRNQITSVTP